MRIAIIQDAEGRWFVRRIASSNHDMTKDEMIYSCDEHLAGPFDTVIDAAQWVLGIAETGQQ